MKTYTQKQSELQHDWILVDATDIPLGRLASQVAKIIRGKHKPMFTPHMDTGDFVIVINASKVKRHRPQGASRRTTSATPATWATRRYTPFADHAREAPGARDREGRLRHAAEDGPRPQELRSQAARVRAAPSTRTWRSSRSRSPSTRAKAK